MKKTSKPPSRRAAAPAAASPRRAARKRAAATSSRAAEQAAAGEAAPRGERPPGGSPARPAVSDLAARLQVSPGSRCRLSDRDPRDTLGFRDKGWAKEQLAERIERIAALQERLWAENHRALLVVLQAPDAGGKDGTIRAVFSGVNPQGCHVTSFKVPSAVERDHGFLWRIHQAVPGKGEIGIFNRSHYEDVLVVRVDGLVPEPVWRARYEQINAFERLLLSEGVELVKIFLHVSRDEQAARLRERLSDPEKRWKFSPEDLEKRAQWDAYQEAYEEALSRCSAPGAEWHVVPADRNWVRNLAVAELVLGRLVAMDPQWPEPGWDPADFTVE